MEDNPYIIYINSHRQYMRFLCMYTQTIYTNGKISGSISRPAQFIPTLSKCQLYVRKQERQEVSEFTNIFLFMVTMIFEIQESLNSRSTGQVSRSTEEFAFIRQTYKTVSRY